MLCLFGPLRRGAAAHLTIDYYVTRIYGDSRDVVTRPTSQVRLCQGGPRAGWGSQISPPGTEFVQLEVHIDKNVVPGQPRLHYIPGIMLGFDVATSIREYIYHLRPPSGGYFLAAPRAHTGVLFYDTPYGNFGPAFKSAIARVFPEMDVSRFSGGTPRKSMAQWLYDAKVPRHVIADIGGWTLSQRDAMDGYHETTPADRITTLANLHEHCINQHIFGTSLWDPLTRPRLLHTWIIPTSFI